MCKVKKQLMIKRPPRIFQLEMRNRFDTLQELDDIYIMSKTITGMIQQSTSRVAKAINKPQKSTIPSTTRALMTKRREMAENGDNKQRMNRVRRNMQDNQQESKRGHQKIQPRNHTRNDHDIKEPEESPKNAEARPRHTDHIHGQAG